jgi:hypothetical protein
MPTTADAGGQPVTDTPAPPPDPVTPLPGRDPDEPARWYQRFLAYCSAGPGRSVRAVYAAEKAREAPKGPGKPRKAPDGVPAAWKSNAATWRWAERAEGWDTAVLERRRELEAEEFTADALAFTARWRKAAEDNHALAELMRGKARERLATLDASALTAADVVALAKAAARLDDASDSSGGLYLGTTEFLVEKRLAESRERQLDRKNNRRLPGQPLTLPRRPPIAPRPPREPPERDPPDAPVITRGREPMPEPEPKPPLAECLDAMTEAGGGDRLGELLGEVFDTEEQAEEFCSRFASEAEAVAELERMLRRKRGHGP